MDLEATYTTSRKQKLVCKKRGEARRMEHKKPIVQRPWGRVVVSDARRQAGGQQCEALC